MKNRFLFVALLMAGAMLIPLMTAQAQNPCDGLKNPTSFVTSSQSNGSWSGQTGNKNNQMPVAPNVTGMNMTSSEYSGSQLASLVSSGSSACNGTMEPSKRFRIMSMTEGPGADTNLGKDPNTNYGLPYAPPASVTGDSAFIRAIRIGNCQTGAEAEGLYYTMTVNPSNALLILYYAIVSQSPSHSNEMNPTFCMRISHNTSPTETPVWTPISDTMSYFISTTASNLTNGVDGWHQQGSGYSAIWWREWNKTTINLMKYCYEQIRVEIFMSDCSAHGHYGYGYVAGDCKPIQIWTSGCLAGPANPVQTLTAPAGMDGYVWYRCDNNGLEVPNVSNPPSSINFRRLTPNWGNTADRQVYNCTTEDFLCHAGADSGQYTTNMVFRCDMRSAMDPSKPYWTSRYMRVNNYKPMTSIDTMRVCEPWMLLTDRSYVPGNPTACDSSLSQWTFYAGPDTTFAVTGRDTGAVAEFVYTDTGSYAVRVRSFNQDFLYCYTDSLLTFDVTGPGEIWVNLTSADTTMGGVELLTQPTCLDSTAVFRAIPYEGYHFVRWDDGDTTNPRTLTVDHDTMFTASFAINQYTVNAEANDSQMGLVQGAGVYNHGDTATLSAEASYGYHFVQWNDGDTANPRTLVVTCDTTMTAAFAVNQYTVTAEVNDTLMGRVTGTGVYNFGDTATLSAEAFPGYRFAQWNDGDSTNPRTLTVTGDTAFVAEFVLQGAPEGINEAASASVRLRVEGREVVVEGAAGQPVRLFDEMGRLLHAVTIGTDGHLRLRVAATGIYLVQIGTAPALRVAVMQ